MTERKETILIKYNQINSEITDSNVEEFDFANIQSKETIMYK